MKPLETMTLEELAREWHATIKAGGVICDVAIELQRRQAVLDAADGMAKAINIGSLTDATEALATYESAKASEALKG